MCVCECVCVCVCVCETEREKRGRENSKAVRREDVSVCDRDTAKEPAGFFFFSCAALNDPAVCGQ